MANVYATKSGNWSDTTVWNTGSLPTSSDDVYANNFTVTINQSLTVLSLRNTTASGISAGGYFDANTAGITLNITGSTPLAIASTSLLRVSNATGKVTINFSNSVSGSTVASTSMILISGNGNCDINGTTFTGGGQGAATCITKSGTGTLNVVGNITGGTSSNLCTGLSITAVGTVNVVGNVTGGASTGTGYGISHSAGDLNVTGNITGGNGSLSSGIISNASSLYIVGSITATASLGVDTSTTTTVIGSIVGNSTAGLFVRTSVTVSVTGNVTASATSNGISTTSSATGVVNLAGNMQNTDGVQAIFISRLFISNSSTTQWRCYTSGGADRTLYSADTFPNSPATGDVRNGTTYGAGSSLTGTLKVPSPSNVLSGVQTDNTVGTYTTTPALIATEIFTKLLSSTDFNTSGSFGKLIKDNVDAKISDVKTSTDRIPTHPASVETTGDQVASYGV